jgi:hypothetical protein
MMRNLLLDVALKTSLVLMVAIGATLLLERASAALRHWILSIAILAAALMPLVSVVLPAWQIRLALPVGFWGRGRIGRLRCSDITFRPSIAHAGRSRCGDLGGRLDRRRARPARRPSATQEARLTGSACQQRPLGRRERGDLGNARAGAPARVAPERSPHAARDLGDGQPEGDPAAPGGHMDGRSRVHRDAP